MKVLVAEKIADRGLEALREAGYEVATCDGADRDALFAAIGDADAIIVRSATKVDAEALEHAPSLKVIGRAGSGVDNVDIPAATRQGILVVNAPQSNVLSVAEHTIGLLLALARNIPAADASLRSGKWEKSRFEGAELHGKTLALLGLGRIGALVAQRALAFGMRILAWDPFVSAQRANQMGVELVTLDEALARADFVSVHVPKTPETDGLLGAEGLAKMKPGARLINAARGGLVDEAALAEALRSGHLAGAALDVFAKEPTTESPLFGLPQVVVTPHLAGSTNEAQDKAGVTIAEQVVLALRGELAPYAVNVEAGRDIPDVLRPFIPLIEKLGRILTHVAGANAGQLEFAYTGDIAEHDTRVLTLSALRGILGAVVHEPVTYVNAPLLAEERGLTYTEVTSPTGRDYVNQVEIRAGEAVVSGTIVGARNEERLTGIFGFTIEMPPGRYMCFLRYDDRPGVIGAIGSILGNHKINIADMRVGRLERGGEALMALTVDQPMTPDVLKELADGSGAKDARFIELA